MARKGREPLTEAPPPAASSSEEEDSGEEEEEEQQHQSSSSDEEEQNTPSTPPPPLSSTKKAPLQKKPDLPKPAVSDSETDSETDSDSPPAKIKPIASKPMKLDLEPKKPRSLSKPTVTALSASTSKRSAIDTDKGSAKKAKKEKNEAGGPAQDEGKKQLFQRLWSEDDEIVILKGMIEYKAKKGSDPMSDADGFLEFIKNSLHVVDAKKDQIVNKIRRLKKKYQNAKKKKITNPHELNAFELSKKIWGNDDGVEASGIEENDNLSFKAFNIKGRASSMNSKGGKGINGPAFEDGKKLEDGNKKNKGEEGEVAANQVITKSESLIQLGDLCKIGSVDEGFMKEGLKLLGEEERVKLEEEWRKLCVAHMEGFLQRLELYRETTLRVWNAFKSANH